jgi:hypothetical protein
VALQFRAQHPHLPWGVLTVRGVEIPVLTDVDGSLASIRLDTPPSDSLGHLFVEFALFYSGGFDLYTSVVTSLPLPREAALTTSKGLNAEVCTLVGGTQHILLKPFLLELHNLKRLVLSSLGTLRCDHVCATPQLVSPCRWFVRRVRRHRDQQIDCCGGGTRRSFTCCC